MIQDELMVNQRTIVSFLLSTIGAVTGLYLGGYGDLVLGLDSQMVGAIVGAVIGSLLLGQVAQQRLQRAMLTSIAAGLPIWYVITQKNGVELGAIVVILAAGFGYLAISSIMTFTVIDGSLRQKNQYGIVLSLVLCTWFILSWFMLLTTSSLNPGSRLDQTNFTVLEYVVSSFFGNFPGTHVLVILNLIVCVHSLNHRLKNTTDQVSDLFKHLKINIMFIVILMVYFITINPLAIQIPTTSPLHPFIWPFNWLFIAPLLTLWMYFWLVQIKGITTVLQRLRR